MIVKECPSTKEELISLISQINQNSINLALLKVGKRWNFVKEILKKEKILNKSLIALNVGMPHQIIEYASKYNKDDMPYFSLILIRFNL